MTTHQYAPKLALEVLLKKIKDKNEAIAFSVQEAIDAGKDEQIPKDELMPQTEFFSKPGRRKKPDYYRKAVPLSHEEALQIVLDVLQSYFVELPCFVNSTADNFVKAAIGVPKVNWQYNGKEDISVLLENYGEEKELKIELQTETQIDRGGEETATLKRVPRDEIEQQKQNRLNSQKVG